MDGEERGSHDGEEVHENPKKKQRGPYKQYLNPGSNKPVPPSTVRSRKIAEARRAAAEQAGQEIPLAFIEGGEVPQEMAPGATLSNLETFRQGDTANDDNSSSSNSNAVPNMASAAAPEATKKQVDYVKKYNLTSVLHRDFSITKLDALLMIMHLSIRHSHTQSFVENMIAFVNTLFGEDVLHISYHIYCKVFPSSESIVKHYFCPDCEISLGSELELMGLKEKACERCKKLIRVNSTTSSNYFISLPMREQIQAILNRPGIKFEDRENRIENIITDIFDGELFQKCRALGVPVDKILTVVFNTDGVRVQNKTQNTMYPILAHINEITADQRFKPENVLLAGLWFGRNAPSMSLFLKPFVDDMLDLAEKGVSHEKPDGSVNTYHVFPLACSVDSVAKPKIVCQKQFNGLCGCLYCTHPNDTTVEGCPPNQRFYDTALSHPPRTEEQVVRDMHQADKMDREGRLGKDSVNGFLGLSVLLFFSNLLDIFPVNTFNIVWSMVIDYMHNALEGVTADLLDLYLNVLTSEQLETFNRRLLKVTPPQGMTRRPRPLSDKVYWKAKEYRGFLLYYAIPCLHDLLPQRDFSLLILVVNAMHILLGEKITTQALTQAKSALRKFVVGFQRLYGLHKVTYNLHLLTHLCDLVEKLGPLWCYSNFIFESCNGRLVKLVKGTKSVINEIAKKITKLQIVPKIIEDNPVSQTSLQFCNNVLGYSYTKSGEATDGVFLTGSCSVAPVTPEECELLQENNIVVNDQAVVRFYNRVIRKGIVFCSKSYSKTKVYDDSCVLLVDGRHAVLDKIFVTDTEKVVCLVIPIRIASSIIPSILRCSFNCFGDPVLVPFNSISRKCVLVSVDDKNFICSVPNTYERD